MYDKNKVMKIAVNLLWVRSKKIGGIESYIRNLLDGMCGLDDRYEMWLIVSKDNYDSFYHYQNDTRFYLKLCNVYSKNVIRRIIWENLFLGKTIKNLGLKTCFQPYYCKPFYGTSGIGFITTIHDLQALHYPHYFSRGKVLWMKFNWANTIKTSEKIITISQFVKNDILTHYSSYCEKINVIYNPILVDLNEIADQELLRKKYGIEPKGYYYTVSSLLPHKNIKTLIKAMSLIERNNFKVPSKLIISGVGGKLYNELNKIISDNGLEKQIIITSFIDNNERNALYRYCKAFLFPSIFEGFGMPPLEAILFGVPVITTKSTSIPEVTNNQVIYVEEPMNAYEWVEKMLMDLKPLQNFDFSPYNIKRIAKKYLDLFIDVYNINSF